MSEKRKPSISDPRRPASLIVGLALLAAVAIVAVMGCQLPIHGGDKPATGVSLNKDTLGLYVGQNERLVATVSPANATNKGVSWKSSDASVTVSSTGLVTAATVGSADVTVTTIDGSFTDVCRVTVTAAPVPATDVQLNHAAETILYGSTLRLTATVLPDDATNKAVTWSASGSSATVASDGLVSTAGLGLTTITATTVDGSDISDSCAVTVIPSLTLEQTSVSLNAGHSVTLKKIFAPDNAPNQAVTWTTSDPDIAAVADDGFVLAIDGGDDPDVPRTATITATAADGSDTATCTVTVTGKLGHTYTEVRPVADAIQEGLNTALATNDVTQPAYCEFDTSSDQWMVTIHLAGYQSSVYTIVGTITAPVNKDYTVGALDGSVSITPGVVTGITYIKAVFTSPRSGTVEIAFSDDATAIMNLATGVINVIE